MSDPEDLYVNEFFSTVSLPDDPLLPPFLPDHIESHSVPWHHDFPNDYISSGAVELFGHFPEPDNDVFMSESQTPGPTQEDPINTVGDPSNRLILESSNQSSETSTHFIDPSLLVQNCDENISDLIQDIPSPNPCLFDGEAGPLDLTELRQPERMSCSMLLSASEDLESRVIESKNSMPSGSDAPISMTITSQKRKNFGPSRDYVLPPLKKGGRRRKMTQTERENHERMREQGACITCRKKKKKCNGEIPCSFCLKNLGPKLSKQPCTKATFSDIVEQNPCFEFSNIYQTLVIETCDNMSFLQQFVTAFSLAEAGFWLELVPDIPLYAGAMTSWNIAVLMFMSVPAIRDLAITADFNLLPPLAPFIKKAPTELMKTEEFKGGRPPCFFDPSLKNLDHRTLFTKKLLFCACRSRTFALYDSTATLHDMGDNEAVQNAAQLVDWFATRYFEIDIFCYLQKSVNKLYKLSISDLYDVITSLLGVIGLLSGYWEHSAELSPKQQSLDQETIRKWTDRHQRLYMALFVYANIAISNLPSWSSCWEELERKFLIKFTQQEFRDMFTDFESFKSKLEVKEKQISAPLDRLSLRSKILEEFYPNFEEETPDQFELPEDFFEFPRKLQSGLVDEAYEQFDLLHMDGLLSATMSGNFDEVRVSKFYSLANIDWELAIERLSLGHFDGDNVNDMLLFHLACILRSRLYMTQGCSAIKANYAKDGFIPQTFVQDLENLIKELMSKENTAMHSSYRKERRGVLLYIREGLRWLELKSLIGGEEIYLLDNPVEFCEFEDKLPPFDIPLTLKYGGDEDFDRLKRLLVSSQSWVQETCAQLQGMVSWIKEATFACKSDRDTALSLSRLIQQKVKSIFGDVALLGQSSTRRAIHKLAPFLEGSPDEVDKLIRAMVERKDNLSFNEDEDEGKDEDGDETASLIKSVQSLLFG
ncbi:uncharacterized protein TRUGW13939_05774 [Talaromyces rugulosus]|uniref:Zn(2)-C6 fungal-type domain-containing protein n=1 Tax=Talaromyces rugulosus TaxID=121627 RepID=A0A7H8QXI2_TALRU|nr:uncharacterized protein TRUGW13939_05774 [Talaromyces rugulosus]QKX58647.1 hypothetical protein TRUGW13939_05774 [Talaromyces rugulosus]